MNYRQVVHVYLYVNKITWEDHMDNLGPTPATSYFVCTLRLSLTRLALAASFDNMSTALTAAVAKLDPQNGFAPAVTCVKNIRGNATSQNDKNERLYLHGLKQMWFSNHCVALPVFL